jgi:hypothetical protein
VRTLLLHAAEGNEDSRDLGRELSQLLVGEVRISHAGILQDFGEGRLSSLLSFHQGYGQAGHICLYVRLRSLKE